jgi:CBS domain-containing protein
MFSEGLNSVPVTALSLREAIVITAKTIVRSAVAKMRFKRLGCAVIVETPGHRPIGIFTERSMIDGLMSNASLDNRPVGELVDRNYMQLAGSEPISSVWDAIQCKGLRFVCVTDGDGNLIGLTGQRGLAEYVSKVSESGEFKDPVLERALSKEPVREIQMGPYAEVPPATLIRQAVHVLHGLKVASLLVVDQEKLVGIFTERDVLERVAERFQRIADAPISEVMTLNPLVVYDTDAAGVALRAIATAGYRHVPVLNASGQLLGIVSPRRVFTFLDKRLEIEGLGSVRV